MPFDQIVVRGAREHNLKNLDVEMPRDRLIVITGLSGSGKSSLAFDTIYAEGQRRYVESLSAYARQFLGQMEKPDVDQIDGLSPAISIDQKGASRNPRSTVGTVTEIYDYLRLLFARIGRMHCPICGREITRQTVEQIVDQLYELPEGTRLMLLAPLVRDRKGEHEKLLAGAKQAGFVRVRVDGELRDLDEEISLDKKYKHSIEVVVDRLVVHRRDAGEAEGEPAGCLAHGRLDRDRPAAGGRDAAGPPARRRPPERDRIVSTASGTPARSTAADSRSRRRATSASTRPTAPARTAPASAAAWRSIRISSCRTRTCRSRDGAVLPWRRMAITESWFSKIIESVAEPLPLPHRRPGPRAPRVRARDPPPRQQGRAGQRALHHAPGRTSTPSAPPSRASSRTCERRYRETGSEMIKTEIERYMTTRPCPTCGGMRLKPESCSPSPWADRTSSRRRGSR